MAHKRILMIYTGGTVGMVSGAAGQALEPVDFQIIRRYLPELDRLPLELSFFAFPSPIDSSNILPEAWQLLGRIIAEQYTQYDGFVVLHGTDTMAYTAAMLSYMFEHLGKPVILTGAQLPIDVVRSDARENLINALEIAASPQSPPEVAICFDNRLMRGNRTFKYSAEKFHAFISPNFPPLAEAGVHMQYYTQYWLPQPTAQQAFTFHRAVDDRVGLIKFYPGLSQQLFEAMLGTGLRALVIETFGSGNLPEYKWLLRALENYLAGGGLVLNITQCVAGAVEQGLYRTSKALAEMGVIAGGDTIPEAAITKLMHVLGCWPDDAAQQKQALASNLRGEMSPATESRFIPNPD